MRGAVLIFLILSTLVSGGNLYEELVREQIRNIPLHKAVVVGKGDRELITVINPDCPHCRACFRFPLQELGGGEPEKVLLYSLLRR